MQEHFVEEAMSQCEPHALTPYIEVTGRYFSQPFRLRIHLQPLPDSEIKEVFDTVRGVARPIKDGQDQ